MSVKSKVKRASYNPKAHSPSVYIPCWLIQVSSKDLSHQAKLLYGRLAQWSSANGTVHRTVAQLAEEIGAPKSTVDRTLKELRDVKLIKTYQAEKGGINHFQFLKHKWMKAPINKNLEYNNEEIPHVKNDVTPTSKMTRPHVKNDVPKIKEIKRNKKEREQQQIPLSVDNFKTEETLKLCEEKKLDFEKELLKFKNHYDGKDISVGKFKNWLTRAKLENKNTNSPPLDEYVKRHMKDFRCTEKEARDYYRQKGFQ